MSKAPKIDRQSDDFKRRFRALQDYWYNNQEQMQPGKGGVNMEMRERLGEEMKALGVSLKTNEDEKRTYFVDSESEEEIVLEEAPAPNIPVDAELESDASVGASGQDLGADVTKEQLDGVLAVNDAINTNSNPAKNKKSYEDAKAVTDKLISGALTLENAKKELDAIGSENSDTTLQVYLASLDAILSHNLDDEKRKEALEVAQKSFAFLGDEKAKHDLEASLLATQEICKSDKISQDLKIKIEEAICNVDVEVVDNSQQNELEGEKGKEAANAEEDKKKKEALEKEEGLNKANIAKKTVKFGAALGIAAGFPPFGIAIAIGMLYVARNWGADEKDKEKNIAEAKAMIQKSRECIAKAKNDRLEEEKLRKELEGVTDPDKEAKGAAVPLEGAGLNGQPLSSDQGALPQGGGGEGEPPAPSSAATATGVAIGAVADDALEGVTQARTGLEDLAAGAVVEGAGVGSEDIAPLPPALEEVAVEAVQGGGGELPEVDPSETDAGQGGQDSEVGESEVANPENSQGDQEGNIKQLARALVENANETEEGNTEGVAAAAAKATVGAARAA